MLGAIQTGLCVSSLRCARTLCRCLQTIIWGRRQGQRKKEWRNVLWWWKQINHPVDPSMALFRRYFQSARRLEQPHGTATCRWCGASPTAVDIPVSGTWKTREGRKDRTRILSIVLIAVLAVIGGGMGWHWTICSESSAMVEHLLGFKPWVPHADTYQTVFERVNPEALQRCFLGWVARWLTGRCAGYPDRRVHERALWSRRRSNRPCMWWVPGKWASAPVRPG